MPWDQAEVTNNRACLGQLYFHVPGGTKYGQYWLNVKFAQSVVRVPFRLFTEEEEKTLGIRRNKLGITSGWQPVGLRAYIVPAGAPIVGTTVEAAERSVSDSAWRSWEKALP